MNSFIFTVNELTVVVNNVPYTIGRDHPRFDDVLQAVRESRFEDVPEMVNIAKAVQRFGNTLVEVDENEGVIRYNGTVLHNTLTDRIIWMMRDGFDVKPFVLFVENLMRNPSKRAVDELYTFMEYGKLPITEDGCFLAYKRIRGNYMDVHSGTCLNKPANLLRADEANSMPYLRVGRDRNVTVELVDGVTTLSMPRNRVQENSQITCSDGLHFCSLEYLKNFTGERIVIMKINPADVVSIPADYNNTKGRCCKYQVVGEYEGSMTDPAFAKSVVNSDGSDYEVSEEEISEDHRNYDDGYNDGVIDASDDSNDLRYASEDLLDAERHDDPDVEYIRGYLDGVNEILTAEEVEVSGDYIEGYVKGHKEGRRKDVAEWTREDLENDPSLEDDYANGYIDGYRDGKNHKARKYAV